jgi:hypothetical protein
VLLLPALLLAFTPAPSRASTATLLRKTAIAAGIIGAGFALDGLVKPQSMDEGPGEVMEEPGEVAGAGPFVFGGTAILGAAGLITGSPGATQTAKDLAVALTLTSGAVWALKYTTQRERPDGSNHYSFPSGHTAVAFAAASVIDKRYGGACRLGRVRRRGAGGRGAGRRQPPLLLRRGRRSGDRHRHRPLGRARSIGYPPRPMRSRPGPRCLLCSSC